MGSDFANGSYELLESSMAQVEGISMNGSIVGVQPGGIGPFYGNGVLTDLVLPGANGSSLITGVNSGSDIVALDSLTWRGYTTIPTPEPGTVSLVEAVGTALIVARRRGRR